MAEHEKNQIHQKKEVTIKKSTLTLVTVSVVTLVVGIVIGTVISTSVTGAAPNAVDKTAAGNLVVDYLNNNLVQAGTTASLVSVEEVNGMYRVTTLYQGSDIPVYTDKSGKMLFASEPRLLNETAAQPAAPAPTSVPKNNKPSVELFVMSYCPYGTQAEKGILPVVRALGDKIDFKIEFTHFTLHGAKEDTENFRQLCIREEQSAKFLPYVACILNSTDVNNPGNVTACMKGLGIDTVKVDDCMKNNAASYYAVDSKLSQDYGVQGSPTLIINGATSSAGRSPVSYLAGICAAFTNPPAECSADVSATQPGPGFGYESTSAATAAGCGI
ncbi:MAG TPA: hypothetical protein VJI12_00300 [archaeon]|nr:hypothetical protein [archaeon]